MSAPGLAVVLSGDGSSSDDGCRIACPQSLPLSRLVNPTHWHEGLVPDFAMPAIPRLLRSTTRTDQWLTQAASTNNERATSTVTGATPPADVANNATIIIEVIPAFQGLVVYRESMRPSEAPLPFQEQGQLYAQALARLFSLIGRSCRCPRTMDLPPVHNYAADINEWSSHPSFPRSAGADSMYSSFWYQRPDTTNHSHARGCRAVSNNDHALSEDNTGAEIQQEDVCVQALLRAYIEATYAFYCDAV